MIDNTPCPQPCPQPCQHVIVPLRQYIEARLSALEQATDVAKRAMDARLEGMNEFRDTLRDQASRFVTRVEADERALRWDADVRELREARAEARGKASQASVMLTLSISLLGLLLAAIGLIFSMTRQ